MISYSPRPTLLVFTLGPECEGQRRQLLPGRHRAAELLVHEYGLAAALDAGRRCGLRLVVASPEEIALPPDVEQVSQRGKGFAQRLRSTIHQFQSQSPETPLLVVGTDVPNLEARHLQEAVSRLQARPDEVVLGPCPDGGFYLLATNSGVDSALGEVRWCQSDTLATLRRALARRGRACSLLDPLRDLDQTSDLELWLANEASRGSARRLVRILTRLLAMCRRPLVQGAMGVLAPVGLAINAGRAPPA